MAVMGMLGVTMAYVMRACLSLTLTQMVLPVTMADNGLQTAVVRHEYCPVPRNGHKHSAANSTESYRDGGQFDWDERTQGQVLSAFYYGYILTHLPGGVLSQRFGGKHTMGLGILSTALFTLLTPYVAYMGPTHLTVLRFVEGLGEVRPAATSRPVDDRGVLNTCVFMYFVRRARRSRRSARSSPSGRLPEKRENSPRWCSRVTYTRHLLLCRRG